MLRYGTLSGEMATTTAPERFAGLRGAYSADRAAALAGVAVSTLYDWARKGIYVPGLSRGRLMLWSWPDLLALRAISWLRTTKPELSIRATTMKQVRALLRTLEREFEDRLGEQLARRSVILRVDSAGRPFINIEQDMVHPVSHEALQLASSDLMIDLLAVYEPGQGIRGPHLLTPRPQLRILPGKLGGEPHIEDTRIETRAVNALIQRGYAAEQVVELYPFLDLASVEQAVDLEDQLSGNLRSAA